MERGFNYLILEERVEATYRAFAGFLVDGAPALCFTTTYPKKVQKKYKLEKSQMAWITEAKADDSTPTVNPKRLQFEITKTILDFIEQHEDAVVLIDGFGYLILENGLDNVRKFVKKVNDKASTRSATIMIPVNPSSFSKETISSMARDFDRMEDFTKGLPAEEEKKPAKEEEEEGALEEVFLVYNNGNLITHNTRRLVPSVDEDVLSGMLTAVQEFVRDSRGKKLGGMSFEGGEEMILEKGAHVYLAVSYRGRPPKDIKDRMKYVLRKVESQYKGRIEDWDGSLSSLDGVDDVVKLVFKAVPKEAPAPPPEPPKQAAATPAPASAPPSAPASYPPAGPAASHPSAAPMPVGPTSQWYIKGLEADRQGRYGDAVEFYTRALTDNPRDVRSWFNKAVACQLLDRHDEAVQCYDQAIALNPNDPEVWSNKGIALRALNRLSEAIASYDRALQINPNDGSVWANKGVAMRALGDPLGAIGCYDRALQMNARDAGVLSNKGVALQGLGRLDDAEQCYLRALEIDPNRKAARKNLEIIRRQKGQ